MTSSHVSPSQSMDLIAELKANGLASLKRTKKGEQGSSRVFASQPAKVQEDTGGNVGGKSTTDESNENTKHPIKAFKELVNRKTDSGGSKNGKTRVWMLSCKRKTLNAEIIIFKY